MSTIKIHVSHDFNRMNANDAFTFGKIIVAEISNHAATFPNLPIGIMALGAANLALNDTYLAYQQGGDSKKGAFLDAFSAWRIKFNKTADYVDLIADGDEAIINQSGFKFTKAERTPNAKFDRLVNLDAIGIRPSGIVNMACDNIAQTGNKGYLFMLSQKGVEIKQNGEQIDIVVDGKLIVTLYAGTTKMHDFNNLPPMTKLQVHGLGFNAAGMGLLTDSIDVLVQ
jgi:hypothetical protein